MKRTKIVCTIGPASSSKTRLVQMMRAGMNVARLNFSHGTYESQAALIRTIRAAAQHAKQPIALLQDLQGPRIRVGDLGHTRIPIKKGEQVVLVHESGLYKSKEHAVIPVQLRAIAEIVAPKQHIYIQDGLIDLQVQRVIDERVYCRVVQGGMIGSHKGINIPGAIITTPVITKKDREDLAFGIAQGFDYVALSFVRSKKDIAALRRLLPRASAIKIIAKIERKEAIKNFDEILDAADGVMVARGDLGVEVGSAKVPLLQKTIVMKCLRAAKPVIVATQMLESMVENPRPTRAEAADVANAVIDHADALMLSAESATGKFPIAAVRVMSSIAREIEKSPFDDFEASAFIPTATRDAGIAAAAIDLATSTHAKAIVIHSRTGEIARAVAQRRPERVAALFAVTSNEQTGRQLGLVWGIRSFHIAEPADQKDFFQKSRTHLMRNGLKKGDVVVLVAGFRKTKQKTVSQTVVAQGL